MLISQSNIRCGLEVKRSNVKVKRSQRTNAVLKIDYHVRYRGHRTFPFYSVRVRKIIISQSESMLVFFRRSHCHSFICFAAVPLKIDQTAGVLAGSLIVTASAASHSFCSRPFCYIILHAHCMISGRFRNTYEHCSILHV